MRQNNIEHKISSFNAMDKRGVTLIEVLVVVIIMGILAGLGVANLQQAVRNARIKDAGINVAAFLERAANDANRLNTALCVMVDRSKQPYKTIQVYKTEDCTKIAGAEVVSEMTLDSQNKFVEAKENPAECTTNFFSTGALYSPRIGLSAAATGCFYVEYGETDHYAAVIKTASRNNLTYKLSYDGCQSWIE